MRFNATIAAAGAVGILSASLMQSHGASAESTSVANSVAQSQSASPSTTETVDSSAVTKAAEEMKQMKSATVASGDSLSSIATTRSTTWVRIFDANASINDPNIINPGTTLVIPLESETLPDRYGAYVTAHPISVTPPVESVASARASSAGTATSYSAVPSRAAPSVANAGNRYTWGTCTWYVYNMKPNIGSFWGNGGFGWLSSARAAGFSTGTTPVAGAIGVESGHVVIITGVSGSTVSVSEMNYAGGLGQVHTRTAPASEFQYIYA